MFIVATYEGEECLLNTAYIVDIFDTDKFVVKVYTLDYDRGAYKVTQEELRRMLMEGSTDDDR